MIELIKAILNKLKANSDLDTAVVQTGKQLTHGFFFDEAPADAVFPYIVYYIISNVTDLAFALNDSVEDYIVQFSIYDGGPSVAAVGDIRDKLRTALDRQTLSYDTKTAVGACVRMNGTGPSRTDDGWMATEDYRIWHTS